MMDEFTRWWKAQFGEVPPLGYMLREGFPSRWLRTHSLPESKRYPESASEYEELLRRYKAVAEAVLGEDGRPWVATVLWETTTSDRLAFPKLPGVTLARAMTVQPDEDGPVGTVYVGHQAPQDTALRAVADDQFRAIWASESTGEVFAPYDGGADLVVRSAERADALRGAFASWLPSRADGL